MPLLARCQFGLLRRLHDRRHLPVLMLRGSLARQFEVLGKSQTRDVGNLAGQTEEKALAAADCHTVYAIVLQVVRPVPKHDQRQTEKSVELTLYLTRRACRL